MDRQKDQTKKDAMPTLTKIDKRAQYQELILEHIDSMFNLAYRLTRNREDANDLIQEASLRGYRFFAKFERGTNFKAWILTILRNIFINQYRKKVKEPPKSSYDVIENMIGAPDLSATQEEVFGEHLQVAVNQLPEELQSVVTLFYVEGLAYKEIAKVMKCPIGTVMSRLHMARQLLKKNLTQNAKTEA